jgi:FixJ family two-component response regulator
MAKVLLFGLERSLSNELNPVLVQLGQTVQIETSNSGVLKHTDANVIFADGANLDAVRHQRPELPVVVVSRLPEVRGWLDALEAGATDYCGAPFETAQVRWVLDSSLGTHTTHRFAA